MNAKKAPPQKQPSDSRQLPIVPPLPSMRDVATTLRLGQRNAPLEGWTVALTLDEYGWRVTADEAERPRFGSEFMPHRSQRFDATRAARRLLFAASDVLNPRVFA
jgi:hypothetical protein